jgi:hypothetical protein
MIRETERETHWDVSSGFTERTTYRIGVNMNLHAPYRFNQQPNRKIVAELASAAATGRLHGTLGESIYRLRKQLAVNRVALLVAVSQPAAAPGMEDENLAHRTALLRDLASQSEHLRECESAVLTMTRCASGERTTVARCPRCHHAAPALRDWHHDPASLLHGLVGDALFAALERPPAPRSDRLVLEHQRGSMLCSGTGEVVR